MSVRIVRLGPYSRTVSEELLAAIFRNKLYTRLDSSTSQKKPILLYSEFSRQRTRETRWARVDERRAWLSYLVLTRRSSWGTVEYSWITSTNSPSFCMTAFRASLTNLKVLLPQSRGCSCYLNGRILAPPPLPLQETCCDVHGREFTHSPFLWNQRRLAEVTFPWSWRLCTITPAIPHDNVQWNCNVVFLVSR